MGAGAFIPGVEEIGAAEAGVAAPGALTARSREGNPGRAWAPATRPMPVAAELRALLEASDG